MKNEFSSDQSVLELEGKIIGDYTCIELITVEKTGAVYSALRNDIEQQVALKFVFPSVIANQDKEAILFEAKALAKLNHPNIATFHTVREIGDTLFFVSELIDGQSLDLYFSDNATTKKDQIQLLITICDAIQYVHQQGIIHSNLKPSNIVVDKRSIPKLVGFSITESTILADSGIEQIYSKTLPLEYVSPELLAGDSTSTWADIYSFGKIIEKTAFSYNPTKELAAIIRKATATQRSDRYASISKIKSDLFKLNNKMPVDTYNIGWLYKFRKLIQRKPIASLTSFSFIVSVLISSLIMVNQKVQIIDEQNRKADLASFITTMYEAANPSKKNPGEEITALDLLENSISAVESNQLGNPKIKNDVIEHLTSTLIGLGEFDRAQAVSSHHDCYGQSACNDVPEMAKFFKTQCRLNSAIGEYKKALDICTIAFALQSANANKFAVMKLQIKNQIELDNIDEAINLLKPFYQLAKSINSMLEFSIFHNMEGSIHDRKGHYQKAVDSYSKAVNLVKSISITHPNLAGYSADLAYALENNGDYKEAEYHYRSALELDRQRYGEAHIETILSLNALAMFLDTIGKYKEAIDAYKEVLAFYVQNMGLQHKVTAQILNNLAVSYLNVGEYELAVYEFLRALKISEVLFGQLHEDVCDGHNNIGVIYEKLGLYDKAKLHLNKALEISQLIRRANHPETAKILNNLAVLNRKMGNYTKAINLLNKARTMDEVNYPSGHDIFASRYSNMGVIYEKMGNYEKAIPLYKKAIDIHLRKLGEKHPKLPLRFNNLAIAYFANSQWDLAYSNQLKAWELSKPSKETNPKQYFQFCINLAAIESKRGNRDEVQKLLQKCEGPVAEHFATTHITVTKMNTLKKELNF